MAGDQVFVGASPASRGRHVASHWSEAPQGFSPSLPRARPVDPKSFSASRSPRVGRVRCSPARVRQHSHQPGHLGRSERTLTRCPLPDQDTLTGPG